MKEFKYIGKRRIREDSLARVTGETKYITDIKKHGMLYGKLVLSEKPHARIDFDFEEALKVEGIYKILTYKDIPKVKYNCMEWFTGINAIKDENVLNEIALFEGDRLALVLGYSKIAVEDAIKKIKINYEELPVITTIEESKKDEVILKGTTNLGYEKEIECGDVTTVFEKADYVFEDRGSTPRTHHAAIENHACMAEIDEFGNLVVSSPGQVSFGVQMHLSNILGIPYSNIRVRKTNIGGSFGGKQQPLLEIISGVASWIEKKTILVYMDRKQSIMGTFTRNPTETKIRTAVTKDGSILGRIIETNFNGGAYDTNASSITNAYAKKLFRLYKIKNQKFIGKAYFTNCIPGGACRAYGGPQAHAVSEINIENIAKKLGIDPCDFRLKNLVDPWDEDPVGGPNLGKAGIKECVIRGAEKFNWKEKFSNIKQMNNDRFSYGVGMACASHGSGYFGAFPDFINADFIMNSDGTLYIKIAVHEQGCGTLDALKIVAGEVMDMDPSLVKVSEADTFMTPYDSAGTQASRVNFISSGAIIKGGEKLKEKLFETLIEIENLKEDDLFIENAKVKVKGTDKFYTYSEIVKMREKVLHDTLNVSIHHEATSNPATFAACFVEVKVDKKTGLVEIIDFVTAHDLGKSVNPLLSEGQIEGGFQFIAGMALSEEVKIDNKGYVKNATFSKYHILNVMDIPKIKSILVETDDETAPFGMKSLGEVTAVAPAPAIINAINHALDVNITDYPATPEKIIEAICNKKHIGN